MSATVFETLMMRVELLDRVADRIVCIELEPVHGDELPRWESGSHIDVHLGTGLVRQYSLSLSPTSGRWRLGVLEELDGRGGSKHVHQVLSVGDEVAVSKPRNTFPFELRDKPIIFVAGGIGITPILSMAIQAQAADADWALLYLSRAPESTAFVAELAGYGERIQHHYDSVDGIIDLAQSLDALGGRTSDIYACGPPGLLSALLAYADTRSGCRLILERFTAGEDTGPKAGDTEFVVELADGTEVLVGASETILEALERDGIPLLSSCQEGVCGTCETAVISGIPDHRDQVLSDEERAGGEMMMPCVSRCVGARICLDL